MKHKAITSNTYSARLDLVLYCGTLNLQPAMGPAGSRAVSYCMVALLTAPLSPRVDKGLRDIIFLRPLRLQLFLRFRKRLLRFSLAPSAHSFGRANGKLLFIPSPGLSTAGVGGGGTATFFWFLAVLRPGGCQSIVLEL